MPSKSKLNRKYGWKPQLPDQRDHKFARAVKPTSLPVSVDMRSHCPAPYNQQQLGSCTANAIAGAIEYDLIKQHLPIFMPSRLFIYYNERAMEGTVDQDAGAEIRDGIKTINSLGVCTEASWPYNTNEFAVKPSATCYTAALHNKSVSYESVAQDINTIKGCLAAGFPVVIGFTVYESFESDAVAATGVMPMPASNEQVLGGHAVLVVGYNDGPSTVNGAPARYLIVRNSWGPEWGAGGYFYMPYEYATDSNLADDFWAIEVMA